MTTELHGSLHLEVMLADGVVRNAWLGSSRPVDLARTMIGRDAAVVPLAFERLFALCGRSHAIAARCALAAAGGPPVSADERRRAVLELAAERIAEHLRSTFTMLSAPSGVAALVDEVDALRAARSATARVVADRTRNAADALTRALTHLGLDGTAPRAGSWADRLLVSVGAALPNRAFAVDPLVPDDDMDVIDALLRLGASYAAAPHVMGRRPETGALARRVTSGSVVSARDRLAGRFAEIAEAADIIRRGEGPAEWIAVATHRPGTGFAAVETPRGRLHQLVAVDGNGLMTACATVAPTEWNFHPDGPFVQALSGLRIGEGSAAEDRIRVLVGLFDPCVGCRVSMRNHANA
jgi:coenzyme F420-reducing hydrogenase alpha subunit